MMCLKTEKQIYRFYYQLNSGFIDAYQSKDLHNLEALRVLVLASPDVVCVGEIGVYELDGD